jgi:hypothetical protein
MGMLLLMVIFWLCQSTSNTWPLLKSSDWHSDWWSCQYDECINWIYEEYSYNSGSYDLCSLHWTQAACVLSTMKDWNALMIIDPIVKEMYTFYQCSPKRISYLNSNRNCRGANPEILVLAYWEMCCKESVNCRQCIFSKKNIQGYSKFDWRKSQFYSSNQKK